MPCPTFTNVIQITLSIIFLQIDIICTSAYIYSSWQVEVPIYCGCFPTISRNDPKIYCDFNLVRIPALIDNRYPAG